MNDDKKNYDLIISLGGNCAPAHNLRYRGLRQFSLPFDWTFIKNENSLYSLAEGFKCKFSNFLIYENLKELSEEEEKQVWHPGAFHYKDISTGYYFVNHFHNDIRTTNEFSKVKKTFEKRVERMLEKIKYSQKILLILSTDIFVEQKTINDFYNTIKDLYPDKVFDFVILTFGCPKDELIESGSIVIKRYARKTNIYDFSHTNYEWSFLDNIRLNGKKKNFKISLNLFGYRIKTEISKIIPS